MVKFFEFRVHLNANLDAIKETCQRLFDGKHIEFDIDPNSFGGYDVSIYIPNEFRDIWGLDTWEVEFIVNTLLQLKEGE